MLVLFGGEAIFAFSLTLLIGILLGTYSSVFIAAPLLLSFKGRIVDVPTPIDPTAVEAPPMGKEEPGKPT